MQVATHVTDRSKTRNKSHTWPHRQVNDMQQVAHLALQDDQHTHQICHTSDTSHFGPGHTWPCRTTPLRSTRLRMRRSEVTGDCQSVCGGVSASADSASCACRTLELPCIGAAHCNVLVTSRHTWSSRLSRATNCARTDYDQSFKKFSVVP